VKGADGTLPIIPTLITHNLTSKSKGKDYVEELEVERRKRRKSKTNKRVNVRKGSNFQSHISYRTNYDHCRDALTRCHTAKKKDSDQEACQN
jgi:hypothetical protein